MIKQLLPLALLSLLPLSAAQAADTVTLHIVVTGLKTTTGTIRACVFKTPEHFPACDKGTAVVLANAPANAPTVKFDIPGVTPGTAAVSLFVDVDNSKKMERNFMGIPKEPIGVSNDATESFGAPKFEKAKFIAKEGETVTIKLRYY